MAELSVLATLFTSGNPRFSSVIPRAIHATPAQGSAVRQTDRMHARLDAAGLRFRLEILHCLWVDKNRKSKAEASGSLRKHLEYKGLRILGVRHDCSSLAGLD
jgi:hypothetical protein